MRSEESMEELTPVASNSLQPEAVSPTKKCSNCSRSMLKVDEHRGAKLAMFSQLEMKIEEVKVLKELLKKTEFMHSVYKEQSEDETCKKHRTLASLKEQIKTKNNDLKAKDKQIYNLKRSMNELRERLKSSDERNAITLMTNSTSCELDAATKKFDPKSEYSQRLMASLANIMVNECKRLVDEMSNTQRLIVACLKTINYFDKLGNCCVDVNQLVNDANLVAMNGCNAGLRKELVADVINEYQKLFDKFKQQPEKDVVDAAALLTKIKTLFNSFEVNNNMK